MTVMPASRVMGRSPISVRWVEKNKGDDESPNIRSRLVAREIRQAGQEAIFALTPPLESLRMILTMASTDPPGRLAHVRDPASVKRTQILLADISKPYFNAKTSEEDPVYVDFPMEAGQPEWTRGLLRRHMYGTRRAAEVWQDECSATLISEWFTQG